MCISVLLVQIILRDLQPKEEQHNIDAVVTMKRYLCCQSQRVDQWCVTDGT